MRTVLDTSSAIDAAIQTGRLYSRAAIHYCVQQVLLIDHSMTRLFFALALVVAGCANSPNPNVILIMADDMGFSDISPYGGEIRTPNLARLAAGGLRFTSFYNGARCCPTRASLLTGQYAHQVGIGHMEGDDGLPGYRGDLSLDAVTIAEALSTNGYRNYMAGKWHITNQLGHWTGDSTRMSKHNWPLQRGFDRFYGTITGAGSFYDPITLTRNNTPIEPETDPYYYTDAISDASVEFIREHEATAPFFLYVSYTAPHWPLHALQEDVARYKGRYDAGWDALRAERLDRLVSMGLVDSSWTLTPRDPRVPAWEDIPEEERIWYARAMEVYAAQIDRMDQGIGRIIEALGVEFENTLIMFLADNGGCAEILTSSWRGLFIPKTARDGSPVAIGNNMELLPGPESSYQSYGPPWANASNTPFRRYKHFVHEGGIATPFIMHWPNRLKQGGAITDAVGHIIDVMATALDAAGTPDPAIAGSDGTTPLEGVSLLPLLENTSLERGPLFWEHEGNRSVRLGQWKLVALRNQPWELYDLETDRTEMYNLISDRPELAEELEMLYTQWAARANVMDWAELGAHRRARRR